ncbi:hypothetical protein PRIPAC_76859, partial [Pristionchus pacificus]|uniref:G_PROTEIN_RECEP_F1_2 domain-containing protein n=1 Tax=Pristionchus pacificus TaxID=54126 RepID=A0A2A6CLQ8_PRIPA
YEVVPDTGLLALRATAIYTGQLIFECLFGVLVALSNLTIILVFFFGWKRLFRTDFYVILANLIVCTSLKGFVELAFVVPYYVLQSGVYTKSAGYFTRPYEYIVFNVSVFADYGVLFFSMLVASDRFNVVRCTFSGFRRQKRLKLALRCVFTWLATAVIPVFFHIFDCQYVYNSAESLYRNNCFAYNEDSSNLVKVLIMCLVYGSYVCAAAILVIYLIVIMSLRYFMKIYLCSMGQFRRRRSVQGSHSPAISKISKVLLLKSIFVFALYAASIVCVFLMPYSETAFFQNIFLKFDVAYIENLLNLSIAAVYPICFLAMSGEMRSILVMKFMPQGPWPISSVRHSSSSNTQPRNDVT